MRLLEMRQRVLCLDRPAYPAVLEDSKRVLFSRQRVRGILSTSQSPLKHRGVTPSVQGRKTYQSLVQDRRSVQQRLRHVSDCTLEHMLTAIPPTLLTFVAQKPPPRKSFDAFNGDYLPRVRAESVALSVSRGSKSRGGSSRNSPEPKRKVTVTIPMASKVSQSSSATSI
jgi:hypothetical protein